MRLGAANAPLSRPSALWFSAEFGLQIRSKRFIFTCLGEAPGMTCSLSPLSPSRGGGGNNQISTHGYEQE
jgi:hypothetical protein